MEIHLNENYYNIEYQCSEYEIHSESSESINFVTPVGYDSILGQGISTMTTCPCNRTLFIDVILSFICLEFFIFNCHFI